MVRKFCNNHDGLMDDSDTAYVMVYQERVLVRVLGRIVTRDDGIQGNMCDKDKFG